MKKGDWVRLSAHGRLKLTSRMGQKKTWTFAQVITHQPCRFGSIGIRPDGYRSIQHFHIDFLEVVDMVPAVIEEHEFNIFEKRTIDHTRALIHQAIKRAGWAK